MAAVFSLFAKAEFLSTPSVRRATLAIAPLASVKMISIHALRAEGDLRATNPELYGFQFLSTPSVRRAT